MQGPKHLHTTRSIRPAPGDPSHGESELSCSRFVVERIHFHCDMKWQRVQSYTELQFWNNWRKNTKGPARMSTADILGHIHNASHIYMHSHTVGMYTWNTHAYTYLSTYHASHICVYTHLYVYAHHACVSQTAWSLAPDAHLRKTGQSYQVHSKPFHNTTCRKSPQGGLRDQINESKCSFGGWQWQRRLKWGQLTNSVSRPALVACGAENNQGQRRGVAPSWEERVKSFWATEHSDHWMPFSWRSLVILRRDGKESATPSGLVHPDKQAKFRFRIFLQWYWPKAQKPTQWKSVLDWTELNWTKIFFN